MSPRRKVDGLAVGAYRKAAELAPHGVEQLGRHLVNVHGSLDAALGWLVVRVLELEQEVSR